MIALRKRLWARQRNVAGLTLVELLVTMTVMAILAAMVFPIAKVTLKREKEMELRRVLRTMREAIDEYKKYSDAGLIQKKGLRSMGYPKDLDILVEGVSQVGAIDKKLRFLRRIPKDPLTGEDVWGKRSIQDDHDSTSWGGQNVFDVYSLSPGTALDETKYSDW
jgi:general secretion pathway protein G